MRSWDWGGGETHDSMVVGMQMDCIGGTDRRGSRTSFVAFAHGPCYLEVYKAEPLFSNIGYVGHM